MRRWCYRIDFDQWRFQAGIGYMRDTDAGSRVSPGGTRDRREWKGSASLLNVPTGLFITAAYVNREFHGNDPSNQAVFGENTVGLRDSNSQPGGVITFPAPIGDINMMYAGTRITF